MTKKDSNILKGVAILLMLFHHLFGSQARYADYGFTGLIMNEEITLAIAKDLKVCVAIFAFASGYGMCKKAIAENRKGISTIRDGKDILKAYGGLTKDTCFLMIICLLLTYMLGLPKSPQSVWGTETSYSIVSGIIANMTAMAGFLGIKWFISSWWYLKVAILFIVLFPLLYTLLKKCGGVILLFLSVILIPLVLRLDVSNDTLWRYLPAFISGMVLADWEVVEKLRNLVENKLNRKVIVAISLTSLLVILVWLKHTIKANFIIQALQAVILALLVSLVIYNIPVLADTLAVFGRNSKYIWLIHVFIYGQLMKEFLFGLKNIWLIFVTLSVVSLLAAMVLKRICDLIETQMIKIGRLINEKRV